MPPAAGRTLMSMPGSPGDLARRLLADLVAVPSENPPGRAYDQVQAVLADWLRRFGVASEMHTVRGKPNLVARVGCGRPVLLVNGHVDVVPADAAGWSYPPYRLTEANGRLYGRGTADMKGALAAMAVALAVTVQQGGPPRGTIVFTATVDEETGGHDGLESLLSSGIADADWALVGEPTGLEVACCGKGVLQQRVTVTGRAAHAAMPYLGANAISAAAEAIRRLEAAEPDVAHPLLGHGTLTVGTIRGGVAANVVAPECQFTVDRRLVPGERVEPIQEEIRRVLHGTVAGMGCRCTVEDILVAQPFETPPDAPIVRWAEAALQALGRSPGEPRGIVAFTDARFPAARGIPTIVLGPGRLEQAHGADEYIEEEQLSAAVALYTRLFQTL